MFEGAGTAVDDEVLGGGGGREVGSWGVGGRGEDEETR